MTIKPLRPTESKPLDRPSRAQARAALETLLRYLGENPGREGLKDTPDRVLRAWDEYFSGYAQDPVAELRNPFAEMAGYDDIVMVRDIDFMAHCEHHMAPILGKAHVAYWPHHKIVGISKLARVVDIHARRLVCQETMTRQIAESLETGLEPKGVGVLIRATHFCMSARGIAKPSASTVTSVFSGVFQTDADIRRRFMDMVA